MTGKEYLMTEATLTSKGQITIPKAVRDSLRLATGDRVEFIGTEEGFVIKPVRRDLSALCGMFKGRRAKPATLEEMKAAIAEMGGEPELGR
jgi:AbrB family looped-hinge helix DNA binding protein